MRAFNPSHVTAVVAASLLVSLLSTTGCRQTSSGPIAPVATAATPHASRQEHTLYSCETFAGITHCPIGSATLTSGGSTLTVTGLGSGADGCASGLSGATAWAQTSSLSFPGGGGGSMTFATTSGTATTSSLTVTQGSVAGRIYLNPTFTGTSTPDCGFASFVYGIFQGGEEYRPGVTEKIQVDFHRSTQWPSGTVVRAWVTGTNANGWEIDFGGDTVTVTMPSSTTYTCTRIDLGETSTPGSHSSFDQVSMRGYLDSYVITAESVW